MVVRHCDYVLGNVISGCFGSSVSIRIKTKSISGHEGNGWRQDYSWRYEDIKW